MKRASSTPLSFFTGSPRLEPAEIEALLDLAGQAALLVDARTRRPLAANDEARRLFGAETNAICACTLDQLFPSFTLPLERRGESTEEAAPLEGEVLFVHVRILPLPGRSPRAVLLCEAFDQPPSPAALPTSTTDPTGVWRALSDLLLAVTLPGENRRLEIDLERVLQAALHAIIRLLDCPAGMAIYLVRADSPSLERVAVTGSGTELPARLPPQELIQLLQPQIWRPDQRSLSALHRSARLAQFQYLATAPVGSAASMPGENGQSVVGLVAIGDQGCDMPPNLDVALPYIGSLVQDLLVWRAFLVRVEELLENQRYNQGLSEVLDRFQEEGIIGLTPELTVRHMNSAAERILGYNLDVVHGQQIENLLIGSQSLTPVLEQALNGRTVYGPNDLRLFRRNGEAFPAQMRLMPIKRREVQLGVLALLKDQSEHEQAREHTQQLEQRALLGEVTAVFAHEVRNPINNISTGLQLMALDLPAGHPNHPLLERLLADCDRLEELMKSVLAFSRPADYVMEAVNLPVLLTRTLDRLTPRMAHVNVKSHFQAEDELPMVQGNARALEQVFFNLMNNAIQAMSSNGGGHLAVRALLVPRDPGAPPTEGLPAGVAYVQVSIADTGPGIPKEDADRIFQPFYTTKRDGAGLGLAIAKRIITAHRGDLRVSSFAGGTVFSVHLPFTPPETAAINP